MAKLIERLQLKWFSMSKKQQTDIVWIVVCVALLLAYFVMSSMGVVS